VATRRHADAVKVLSLSRTDSLLVGEDEQDEEYTAPTLLEEEQNEEIWSQMKEFRHRGLVPVIQKTVIRIFMKSMCLERYHKAGRTHDPLDTRF